MGLFDFLSKKKEKEKKEPKKEVKKEEKISPIKAEKKEKELKPQAVKSKKNVRGKSYQVLHSPHVTEKATDLSEKNKYVFKVYPRTNKIEIKKAVRDAYGIDVTDVKIINVPRKKRRLGKRIGWKKGYKKAIVKVKEGQKIEILPR